MFGDAGVLSFQLDSYRWEDHLRRMRDIREKDFEQDTAAIVVAQYNDLVHRYNALAEAALKAGRDADASKVLADAAELQVIVLDREVSDLKQQLAAAAYDLESSHTFWKKEADYYENRALAAESELKALRSQHG